MNTLRAGIVLLPDDTTTKWLIQTARTLPTENEIDFTDTAIPHLTIIHFDIEEAAIEGAWNAVANIAVPTTGTYTTTVARGQYVQTMTHSTPEFVYTQQALLTALAPHIIPGSFSPLFETVDEESGNAVIPHFTLGWLEDPKAWPQKLQGEGVAENETWTANKLALVRVAEHGTAVEVLYSTTL